MPIKKRSKLEKATDLLADELADRAYGEQQSKLPAELDDYVVTSVSINRSMLYALEDLARSNKRNNSGKANISALVRQAVNSMLYKSTD